MNNTAEYENEIDLKKLCIYILRKWKVLLIAFVVGALLLGLVKAFSSPELVTDTALVEANQTKITEYQTALSTNQSTLSTNKSTIASNKNQISINEAAIEDQNQTLNDLQDVLDTHEQMLDELEAMQDTGLTNDEQVVVLDRAAEMTGRIYDLNAEIADVRESITNYENHIETLQQDNENLEAANKTLTANIESQQTEIDRLTAEMEPKQVPVSTGDIVTYTIIGALLGIILVCIWLCIKYIFSKKLKDEQDLVGRYGFYILGVFNDINTKQQDLINRLLDKWTGIRRDQNTEDEYRLIAAKIQMSENKQPMHHLMVTGTLPFETLQEVEAKLKSFLPAEQYEIHAAENLAYNSDVLTQIKQYEIVLVEKKDASDAREIEELAEVLKVSEVHVVGAIVL